MEADKPSGPIATDSLSPVSSNSNKPAAPSYLATPIGGTVAAAATPPPPPPLHPPHPPALHNAHPAVMDLDTTTTDDRSRRATSVISMDDLEAAQALEGLRSGMLTRLSSILCNAARKAVKLRLRGPRRCRRRNNLGARPNISANPSPSRIWPIPSSTATDTASSVARPAAARAALVATHFFPPANLLRYQRVRLRIHYLQVVLGTIQVRSRVYRAQHWFASRKYRWNGRSQDRCGEWSALGIATARIRLRLETL